MFVFIFLLLHIVLLAFFSGPLQPVTQFSQHLLFSFLFANRGLIFLLRYVDASSSVPTSGNTNLISQYYSGNIQNHWLPIFTESISSSFFAFHSVFFLIPLLSASSATFVWATEPDAKTSCRNSFAT